MVSSEVQTDTDDPLGNLVEHLDGLSTREEEDDGMENNVPTVAQSARVMSRLPDDTGELTEMCGLSIQYYLVICELTK